MKDVKIVVGANYGDEGKGLLTRHFVLDAIQNNKNPIVVLHNGTAQRGHTVDYNPNFRHVFHHFGSGSLDGAPTFFASSFWVHPMEYAREYMELWSKGFKPSKCYCDPDAYVITPFDMLVDHATEDWIEIKNGEREYASCGYGTWCATSRYPKACFTVRDFYKYHNSMYVEHMLHEAWVACVEQLVSRGVDVEKMPQYKDLISGDLQITIHNFIMDLRLFFNTVEIISFDSLYEDCSFDSYVFENGQGLGLDTNSGNEWNTTSHTGIYNPLCMLNVRNDFNAEVCYVTRSYLTRHGIGTLEEETKKDEINSCINDRTNLHNEFQGSLRYGYLDDKEQKKRIIKDWSIVDADCRFKKTMAVTHCNEFEDTYKTAEYMSRNPYSVIKRG